MENELLGQMAVHYGLVTAEQLDHCLEVQATQDPPRFLGEVLVEEGLVSRGALERLLTSQRRQEGTEGVQGGASGPGTQGGASGPGSAGIHFPHKAIAERAERADLNELLKIQVELGATDLHLASGARATARVNGRLASLAPQVLTAERCQELLRSAFTTGQLATLERERSALVHLSREGVGRFRVGAFLQTRGPALAIRRIPERVPELEWLGLPPIVKQIPKLHQGLVLVTGPRGSGKTTTLAAAIELINQTRRCHVVTLERPVEYVIPGRCSLISQREVGLHVPSYAEGLRSLLRESPDVIVLAEMVTPEQIMAALTAAETGHLVMGTLHTSGAYRTVLRVLDAYAGHKRTMVRSMLANVLRLVISQQLLTSREGDRLHLAAEVMVATTAVSNMIREDRVHQLPQAMQTSRKEGMVLMDQALARLVREKKVAVADAVARAQEPAQVLRAGEEG
mgnify:CR=1 FL=1